jgi:effector-binding domain-containing protein
MGLFKRLFGKPEIILESESIFEKKEYPEDWDFYHSLMNKNIGSIYVNLGLKDLAPIIEYPYLLKIAIEMNLPTEGGLLSSEESKFIGPIERQLRERLCKNLNSIFVGHVQFEGFLYLYYYCANDRNYESAISEIMRSFSEHSYTIKYYEDKNWKEFSETLYPNNEQFFRIQNRRKVERLNIDGDSLIKKRNVYHTLVFNESIEVAELNIEAFLNEIKDDGYVVDNKHYESYIYMLRIKRLDKVDFKSLDEYTSKLWRIANKHNGEYVKWDTTLEKD